MELKMLYNDLMQVIFIAPPLAILFSFY